MISFDALVCVEHVGTHRNICHFMYTSVFACSLLLLAYETNPPLQVLCDVLIRTIVSSVVIKIFTFARFIETMTDVRIIMSDYYENIRYDAYFK